MSTPHRQDEGMLPCPFCGAPEPQFVCGGPGNWYVRCLACGAASDDAMRDRALKLWNTRAAPPSEGTACPECGGEGHIQTHADGRSEECPNCNAAIPSKPAPDALREAITGIAERHVGAWCQEAAPELKIVPTAARQDIRAFVDDVLAALSAPVPPADGAMRVAGIVKRFFDPPGNSTITLSVTDALLLADTVVQFEDTLRSIAEADESEPRAPDDADWRWRFLEAKRAANVVLSSTPPTETATPADHVGQARGSS